MKKLVAFVMVLSLGLFCAVGCNKPAAKKDKDAGKTPAAAKDTKADEKAGEAKHAKADEKAAAPTEEKKEAK